MDFFTKTGVLVKKDLLLIARRRWFSTFIRAIAFPIVLTVIIAKVKDWIGSGSGHGIGSPSPVISLPDAFALDGNTRPIFAIVDRGLPGFDVKSAIQNLTQVARNGNRDVRVLHNTDELKAVCPSSSKGVTSCFGAVDFWASPEQGPGAIWNYTIWQDSAIGGQDVYSTMNGVQVYTLPLHRAVDSVIATLSNTTLPSEVLQYPYTTQTQAQVDYEDSKSYSLLITFAIGFAFFLALVGIAYHLTGHVVRHREEGMLQLIDAQMPNASRWESLFSRMLATHVAFDLVYAPAWIVSGAVMGSIVFPHTNAGWYVLLYVMCGLAMTSYSVLASSLFRRVQLSSISATVAAVAFSIVAQFALSGQPSTTQEGALATALLFPPAAFIYYLDLGAVAEILEQPLNPTQQLSPLIGEYLGIELWSLTVAQILGFFTFQIVVYPILALIIERFLWGSSFKGRVSRSSDEMSGNAVRIKNFAKRYKAASKHDRTLAVKDLSLDLYAGSITVLLGANGSGKSTTLNCIAGLESITEGEIELDQRGGLGLCPQRNVMWGEMTVEEHVSFFQQLKNPSLSRVESRQEVERLIDGCDLRNKRSARAKTLSGGQKRKLQMAMMLAGGSRVCCIDEASSGIDPLARRKIWDILMRERGQRTLLLTTHFLDEGEVLADHIAILSDGQLRAEGSVSELKNRLGGGFRVIVRGNVTDQLNVGGNITQHAHHDGIAFKIPDGDSLAHFLDQLEQHNIDNFKVEGPTIEKIFLDLAEEMKPGAQRDFAKDLAVTETNSDESITSDKAMALHTPAKPISSLRQTWVLIRKRLTILKRNPMAYLAALFVPLTVAGCVTLLLPHKNGGLQCHNRDQTSYYYVSKPQSLYPYNVARDLVVGPPDIATATDVQRLLPNATFYTNGTSYGNYGPMWNSSIPVNSLNDFNTQIKNHLGDTNGGIFLGNAPVFAWRADGSYGFPAALAYSAVTDTVLLNQSIAVSYNYFTRGYSPQDFVQSLVAVLTCLGFILYPGLFSLYITKERLQNVRAMMYSNGITSGPLWTAYAIFDFFWLLLISIAVTAIWAGTYSGWYGLGYLFVVFLFYGLAAVAYSYIVSLFVKSQLSALALTTILNVVIAMLYFVGNFLTVDQAPLTSINSQINIIYFTVALISPAVSLMRALLVTLNVYGLACDGQQLAAYPGGITKFGGPILYLVLQSIIFVVFMIYWESGRSLEVFGIRLRSKEKQRDDEKEFDVGGDATEDSQRLSASNKGLRVEHVSKTFGRNKAVDDVNFGILPSEKFALLGPNGAGKSTTISLIRGELQPDASSPPASVHIFGDSLRQSPMAAKHHLGVCPQFDAVDSMTLSEHLHFYARSRGLSKQERNENINEIITRLGLTPHAKKMVKKLSGGTKRKLSLGIALVANPSVILLDEPSSGMDAAAKRALWDTLRSISEGRSLLLTTHSMEEADALCDRAGIIASQMLALGTISDLHARHSHNVYMQLVHRDAPRSSDEDMEQLWQWAQNTFLVAERERSVNGQIRFSIPIRRPDGASQQLLDGSNMGRLFRTVETSKSQIALRDYSIGGATLDQVFLSVVSKHGYEEENSALETKKSLWRRVLRR